MYMNIISVNLVGGLGNYFFEIISVWAFAKKNNLKLILPNHLINSKYFSIFFNKIELGEINNIIFKNRYNLDNDVNGNLNETEINKNENIFINGWLQNANNFNEYRNEILLDFFDIKELLQINNKFFIHIRLTDFLLSRLHGINLQNYYLKAINYLSTIRNLNDINFMIISDDIEKAKTFKFISSLPKENISYIGSNEYDDIKTLDIIKNCYLGGIISNSTFAWWGAYIINNPNKIIICPNIFLNTNLLTCKYNFSSLYMDYKIIDV